MRICEVVEVGTGKSHRLSFYHYYFQVIAALFVAALFLVVTPNSPAQVADPLLSVSAGTSSSTVTVTATTSTPEATIYYTTNGTTPTSGSAVWPTSGSLVINQTTTLKLQAYQGDAAPSDVITAKYTISGWVTSGSQHALAIKPDGTVWAWGANSYGQLSTSTTNSSYLPVQTTVTGVNPIAAFVSNTMIFESGIPLWWMLQNFGQTGLDPNALAPNGGGLTILQCYQQNIDPRQTTPAEPLSVSIIATGTYQTPANILISCGVTCPSTTTISRIEFYGTDTLIGTVTAPPYQMAFATSTVGNIPLKAIAYTQSGQTASDSAIVQVVESNRYDRGWGTDTRYLTTLVAVDFQQGKAFDNKDSTALTALYPSGYPWFLRTQAEPRELWKHIVTSTNSSGTWVGTYNTFNYTPYSGSTATGGAAPMVAFGTQGGGSALYVNQSYEFGVAAGGQLVSATTNPDIKIEVFQKSAFTNTTSYNVAPIYTTTFSLPRTADTTGWSAFAANGYVKDYPILVTLSGTLSGTIDLKTQVQYLSLVDALSTSGANLYGWGQLMKYPLLVTHKAGNSAFCYKISYMGYTIAEDGLTPVAMAQDTSSLATYNLAYTLDFDDASPWQSTYINQTHFQGTPLPSAYAGKSLDELIHNAPMVTDTLPAPTSSTFSSYNLTQLNNSPELKTHPLLDQLADSIGNDPMALANYIANEIDLTDAIGYDTSGVNGIAINPQGVSRDALGVYLEGQGNPAEQCALLVYLLRHFDIPCGYVFPANNSMQMFDQQLSKMLRMQIRSASIAPSASGPYNTPVLIPVNYPWVAAYINNKWVDIFPWIKDTSVTEGADLWNYMPTGYKTGGQFLLKYLQNDTAIRGLSTDDNLGTLFPLFVQKQLAGTGLSMDDIGMKIYNRRNYYTRWEDFPRPWTTPTVSASNLAQSLTESQNPNLASTLHNIFDTVSIQIISDRNNNGSADSDEPTLATGTLRMTDIHDRRLLLYHQVVDSTHFKLILSLEPYSSTDTGSYTFTSTSSYNGSSTPDTTGLLRGKQIINTTLQTTSNSSNDDLLLFKVDYLRHRQVQSVPTSHWNDFLGVWESTEISDSMSLRKGDMACLCTDYGRVSQKMMEYQAEKYWRYQQTLSNSSAAADPEQSQGQLLYVMGQSYYNKCSTFQQNVENWTKTHAISWAAHGLSKLSPTRDSSGAPTLTTSGSVTDISLRYPNVDMSFLRTAYAGNGTTHLDSGTDEGFADYGAMELMIAEVSADEHRVINQFFQQSAAASTVRLLDIAQGWTPATGTASHPGSGFVTLTAANFTASGAITYGVPKSSGSGTTTNSLAVWAGPSYGNLWEKVTTALTNTLSGPFTTVLMTQGPVTATVSGQTATPYTGMGAFVISTDGWAAYISGNIVVNGGYGSANWYSIPSYSPPQTQILSLVMTPTYDYGYSLNYYSPSITSYTPSSFSLSNYSTINSAIYNSYSYLTPSYLSTLNSYSNYSSLTSTSNYSYTGSSTANAISSMLSTGYIGSTSYYGSMGSTSNYSSSSNYSSPSMPDYSLTGSSQGVTLGGIVQAIADPVNAITGEFYIDALDLKLNGPMPLEIRRVYGSLNNADNSFGQSWRMSYFPYLQLSTATDSATTSTVIYAAEQDGSVIAYQHQTSPSTRWIPTATYNPTLANSNDGKIGGAANLFNNRIDRSTSGSDTFYTLTGADGSVRKFKTMTFSAATTDGVTSVRPYLQTWSDANGNTYTFSYGLTSIATDYGQVNRIASSNGDFVGFNYDTYAHITEAYTGDGRRMYYQYDTFGDLTQVTLPDASSISYAYLHLTTTTNSVTTSYSTHLLTQETKPGGRILQNVYESANNYASRRVAVQSASVGSKSSVIANATFSYTVTLSNSSTFTPVNGYTTIKDVNGNYTTYTYSGSQITGVKDPLNQAVSQVWYTSTASGGFPRSLATLTDSRGLGTSYKYDSNGNLLQLIRTGNLTGGASSSETATTTMSYNTTTVTLPISGIQMIANTVATVTDPAGVSTVFAYGDSSHPFLPTSVSKVVSGTTVATTLRQYTNVTGSTSAYGLLKKETIASGTSDQSATSYTWDGHGFLTSQTQYTNTNDPNVTTQFTYNLRGELTSQTDAAGRVSRYTYDARGNRTGEERTDEWGNLISWGYVYYNQNGEPEWIQGPRYSPNDYVYKQYNGGGRLQQEVKWLSAASTGGKGVASKGYATTSYVYDNFGNLVEIDDANQNATTMTYNSIGQVTSRTVHTGSATGTALATETFSYSTALAPLTTTYTSALGGVEVKNYTSTGKIKSVTQADGTTVSYLYDLSGRVVRETLTNGSYWVTAYNDVSRTITRTFYNSGGTQLAQEIRTLDRRGNAVSATDAAGNTFTTTFDGLNRVKKTTGPGTSGNSAQQISYHVYDAAGVKHTVTNAAGESTVTYMDALGRPTLVSVFNSDGKAASNVGYWYSPDHNSVVTTVGSGTNAVTTTEYTDTMGLPVLTVYGDGNYVTTLYDSLGNRTRQRDEHGAITIWSYDALNRLATTTLPYASASDSAVITNTYTISSGLTTTQAMPGGITSKTVQDTAGRTTLEQLLGSGGATTRTTTYSYYTTGSYKGLLQSVIDPRGFTTTTSYDSWLRPVTVNSSGSSTAQQNQNTSYAYDNRGMVSTITQSYAVATTGNGTVVNRTFDAYGNIASESVLLTTATNSTTLSQWAQSWDKAGRRSALNFGLTAIGNGSGRQYSYTYNALGLLASVSNSSGLYSYAYGDNGLLKSRTCPWVITTIGSRDNRGRILSRNVTQSGGNALTESMSYRDDSRMDTYTVSGILVNAESRTYGYDIRGRLLTEPYLLSNSTPLSYLPNGSQTALYAFDQTNTVSGTTLSAAPSTQGGLGVRTLQYVSSYPSVPNGYAVSVQNTFKQPTTDYVVRGTGTTLTFSYDLAGNVSSRAISTQQINYIWDSFGRLAAVNPRDSSNNGYNWITTYDGLGRRLYTTYQAVSAGTATGAISTMTYFYDPATESLEIGTDNGSRAWKVCGPDTDGTYAGQNGCGGIDAVVYENTSATYGQVQNYFGDSVALAATATQSARWTVAIGAYGGMPGSGLPNSLPMPVWRGHYADWTGLVYFDQRYYEPTCGRWLSPDPMGHGSSMSLYDYCNGDPINQYDAHGRFGKSLDDSFTKYLQTDYGYTRNFAAENRMFTTVANVASLGIVGGLVGIVDDAHKAFTGVDIEGNAVSASAQNWAKASLAVNAALTVIPIVGEYAAIGRGAAATFRMEASAVRGFAAETRVAPAGVAGWAADGSELVGGVSQMMMKSKVPQAGQDLYVGTYNQSYRANVRAGLNATYTPHHAVQDAVSLTTHGRGITINLSKDLHALTRTFNKPVETGLTVRQHLARDVVDLRGILRNAGYDRSKVNTQLQELIRQNKLQPGFPQ